MDNTMPILLVPGLVSSPRIFAPVAPALWPIRASNVAQPHPRQQHGRDCAGILAEAPPLRAGRAFDGRHIAFEIMRRRRSGWQSSR